MINFVVFFIVVLMSFVSLANIVNESRSFLGKVIVGSIWLIMCYYMILYFSQLLYIEDQEELKQFWTITANYIFNSDYHYYFVTAGSLITIRNELQYRRDISDLEAIMMIQFIYFLLKLPVIQPNLYYFCIVFQIIIMLSGLWYSSNVFYIGFCYFLTYLFCYLIIYIQLDFFSFWDFFIDYVFWNLAVFTLTYLYLWGLFFYYAFSLYYFPPTSENTDIRDPRIHHPNPLYYLSLPIGGLMSIAYQILVEYCYGSTISFIYPFVIFTYTTPAAYLMSIRNNLQNLDAFYHNSIALFFTTFTIKVVFFS